MSRRYATEGRARCPELVGRWSGSWMSASRSPRRSPCEAGAGLALGRRGSGVQASLGEHHRPPAQAGTPPLVVCRPTHYSTLPADLNI